jgi:methylase of polypeptide subunit release factors
MSHDQTGGEWYEPLLPYTGPEKPTIFAKVLADNLPVVPDVSNLLDIGCAAGSIAYDALINKRAQRVSLNDIRPKWLNVARRNAEILIKEGAFRREQVSFTAACSFRDIPADVIAQQTLMAFNPPQLPIAFVQPTLLQNIASDPISSTYRIGGTSGLDLVKEFFEWYANLSTPKPIAVINLSAFLGQSRIEEAISLYGLRVINRKETRVPLRSLFSREKIGELSSAELKDKSLEPDGNGWWTKNLLTLQITGE